MKHLDKIWFAEIDVAKTVQKICEKNGEHLIRLNLRIPDEVREPDGIGVTVDPDRNASVEGNYNNVLIRSVLSHPCATRIDGRLEMIAKENEKWRFRRGA